MTGPWRDAALAAARICTRGTSRSYCGRPATTHLQYHDGTTELVCSAHSVRWGRQRHRDWHTIGGECGLPGTQWVKTSGGLPGRCIILGLDMPDLFATDTELCRVLA